MSSNLSGLQSKEERVQIVPSFWNCSKAGDDCSSTGCCQVSGHTCFAQKQGKAFCQKGFTCEVINPHSVPVAARLGQNLYCFSVYTENIGNDKIINHELELLNIVAAQGKGIFACEQWDVFSEVAVGRLHHQGRRRCCFRPSAFEDLVELQTRRLASWPLLRELSKRPVWLLRPPGDHHQNSSRGAHDVFGGLPRRVRTLRKRWLRLEVGRLGQGCLRPEVHGSPLRRQGRGIRRGHRWCVRI